MTDHAVVTLKTLRCLAESDRGGSNHSEPYIWPFLASIAERPFSFEIDPKFADLTISRKILRNEMRAGQSVTLDFPGNRFRGIFPDQASGRHLILIVALLESDDLRKETAMAGYQAFIDELRLRLGHRILEIADAVRTNDSASMARIVAELRSLVTRRVREASRGALTTGEKARIAAGFFNLDDFIATEFVAFSDPLRTTPFTLRFSGDSGDPRVSGFPPRVTRFPAVFELDGELALEPVVVDPCQSRVDAVRAAEKALRSLHGRVQSLQEALGQAAPHQKAAIIASIDAIRAEIPAAERALAGARDRLRRCRIAGGLGGGKVKQPVLA